MDELTFDQFKTLALIFRDNLNFLNLLKYNYQKKINYFQQIIKDIIIISRKISIYENNKIFFLRNAANRIQIAQEDMFYLLKLLKKNQKLSSFLKAIETAHVNFWSIVLKDYLEDIEIANKDFISFLLIRKPNNRRDQIKKLMIKDLKLTLDRHFDFFDRFGSEDISLSSFKLSEYNFYLSDNKYEIIGYCYQHLNKRNLSFGHLPVLNKFIWK